MLLNLFSSRVLFVSALLILIVLPLTRGNDEHNLDKRQIGVLARTGALPQGKRSVEALARNGELPLHNNNKRDTNNQYVLDLLIQELAAAEGLSRLHLQALTERLLQQREDAMEQESSFEDLDKRSVSSVARTGGLPQKRNVERNGYIVQPPRDTSDQQPDLLDPDDFLGKSDVELFGVNGGFDVADSKRGGLASLAKHGYIGKREGDDDNDDIDSLVRYLEEDDTGLDYKRNVGAARNFLVGDKRHVGSAKNFLSYVGDGKRNIGSFKNFGSIDGKRNLGSARNFGTGKRNLGAAKNFMDGKRNIGSFKNFISANDDDKRNVGSALRFLSSSDKRHVGAARNFLLDETKRNIGAAKNFFLSGSKKNLGAARNFLYGKRNLASFARDGGFSNLKYPSSKEFNWDDDEFDFDDFHDDEKRYIGSLLRNQEPGKRYIGSLKGRPFIVKRNLGSFKNFGKRPADGESDAAHSSDSDSEDVGKLLNDELTGKEKRQTNEKESHVNGTQKVKPEEKKGDEKSKSRRKRETYLGEYPMPVFQNTQNPDYEDLLSAFADEANENDVEKRFLGRIPQMGRVHQKTQTPSGRRRPQLRPNWL